MGGKAVNVPYKGSVEPFMSALLGGIRSTCTYVGARKLKELSKRTTFIRVQHHHNTVFGDEKNEPKFSPQKKESKQSEKIDEKKALLVYLKDDDVKENKTSAFDLMSPKMKREYFQWVQQQESTKQ